MRLCRQYVEFHQIRCSRITNFPHFGILISRFAYAIMPLGKRENTSMRTKKSEAPSTGNTEGFFLFIYSRQETTRLVLSYLSPSNHLMMQWQTTPAAQETKKERILSMKTTSSRCRVSVRQRCYCIIGQTQKEYLISTFAYSIMLFLFSTLPIFAKKFHPIPFSSY